MEQYFSTTLLDSIPETRWYFENIDYKPTMSECRFNNSQSKDWQEYSAYLWKSYDFETWQKGSQAWWLHILTSENFAAIITILSQ